MSRNTQFLPSRISSSRAAAQDARIAERFAAQDARIDQRFAVMERRLVGFEARMESQLERPESRLLGRIEEMVGSVQSKQQKWTIGLWTTTVLAVVATRLFLAQGLDLSRPNPTAEFPPPFA